MSPRRKSDEPTDAELLARKDLSEQERLLLLGPEEARKRELRRFYERISTCDRLACPNPATLVCPVCFAAYCDDHPPINDGDPSTCDACGYDFEIEPEPAPEPIFTPKDLDRLGAAPGIVVGDGKVRRPRRKKGEDQ